jgi:uncharacterized membrane protein YcaP (DUF421 family)
MERDIFFNGWADIARTLLVGGCAYVLLIVLLRISGKRTLARMDAFDFVVTVAFGSTLATVLLAKEVSLAEGFTAFATLIIARFIITWASVRSAWFRRLVKSEPTLLFYQGGFVEDAMRSERVTRAAMRSENFAKLDEVGAVVLETDGRFTVLPATTGREGSMTALNPHMGGGPQERVSGHAGRGQGDGATQ